MNDKDNIGDNVMNGIYFLQNPQTQCLYYNNDFYLQGSRSLDKRKPTKKQTNQRKQRNMPSKSQSTEQHQENPASKKTKRRLKCTVCNMRFNYERSLNKHLLLHNDSSRSNEFNDENESDQTKYRCEICLKSFSTFSDFGDHKAIHSDAQFKCDECPRKFKFKYTLQTHKRQIHTDASLWKFECYVCRKRFTTKYRLEQHIQVHFKQKVLKCEHCKYTCCGNSYMSEHVKFSHPDKWIDPKKVFECEFCGRLFKQESLLNDHVKIRHPSGRQFECPVCKRCFANKPTLTKHKSMHDDNISTIIECNYCDLRFGHSISKVRHEIRFHGIKRTFECLKCHSLFVSHLDVRRHMSKCLDKVIFSCDICPQKYFKKCDLQFHKRYHFEKQFQCDECPKKFFTKYEIALHKQNNHSNSVRKAYFKCQFCEKSFWMSGRLIRHLQSTHHELLEKKRMNLTDFLPDELKPKAGYFQCKFCSNQYASKTLLNSHVRIHTKPLKCEQCDYRCPDESRLFNHIRNKHFIGSNKLNKISQIKSRKCPDKLYECFICHLTYRKQYILKIHMLEHGEKKFQCNNCPQKFCTQSRLQCHQKTHSKPYKCKMCSFRCTIPYSLFRHVRKEHPDEIDPKLSNNPSVAVVKLRYDARLGVWT